MPAQQRKEPPAIIVSLFPGRISNAFNTNNLTVAGMCRENVITNWSIELSGAMSEGGMLLLSMRWYPTLGQDAPAEPEGLPIARKRDGLCIDVADSKGSPT